MLILVIALSAFPAASEDLKRNYCNIYSCKPDTVSFTNTTCIYPSLLYSTYYLSPCPSSLPYCSPDLTLLTNTTCQKSSPVTAYSSYPGEPCNVTSDCVSGTCFSGVCFGANIGQACTAHMDCNPGYHCSNKLCAPLISSGKTGCLTDYDCIPSAGCNINSTAGLCTPYFSLKNDVRISICNKITQGGYSFLCTTGVCLSSSSRSSIGVCSAAPVSVSVHPRECLSNSDCQAKTNDFNYVGTCTCGINPYAASYCQPFYGDIQGTAYISALKAFVSKGYTMQCNTMRRWSKECWGLFTKTKEYATLFSAKYVFDNYPLLQNNDLCIKSIIFNDYYKIPIDFAGILLFASAFFIS